MQRVRTEGVEPTDDAPDATGSRSGNVVVVELDNRLRRDWIRRNDIVARLRRAHAGYAGRGDAPVETVVVEEDPLARLGVDLVVLQVRWGKQLEVVEVLTRQHGHPVAGMDGHARHDAVCN